MSTSELSAYELERNRTIEENKKKLIELGLEDTAAEVREHAAAKREGAAKEKTKRLQKFPEPTRASKRIREEKPQCTGQKIDRFGEELDAKAEKVARSR